MHPVVEAKRGDIAQLCRQLGVLRLDLFGSATGSSFDLLTSDVDVVVEFTDNSDVDAFSLFFDLKEGLERILDRPVDVITARSIINPYLRAGIDASKETLYAA